ncbi:MAG: class A beta-lactamase [Lysobacterales bacterium]
MHTPDSRRRRTLQWLACTSLWPLAGMQAANSKALYGASTLSELERRSGGRLGVCVIDSGSGRSLAWRGDERFGMCSTFKLLLAAIVLREADAGRLSLDTVLPYTQADMVPYAPVTEQHLAAGGMSIGALTEATQTTSDNVAANLLIRQLGGPAQITATLRAMGDSITRLDRLEPEMNLVPAGEERDTTSPCAMADTVADILAGDWLSASSRSQLRDWLIATRTGARRIRAGLPAGWTAGDKTGTGIAPSMANKYNDVAVIWPAGRKPVVVAAYFEASAHFENMRDEDEAVLADVGRIAAEWIESLPAR